MARRSKLTANKAILNSRSSPLFHSLPPVIRQQYNLFHFNSQLKQIRIQWCERLLDYLIGIGTNVHNTCVKYDREWLHFRAKRTVYDVACSDKDSNWGINTQTGYDPLVCIIPACIGNPEQQQYTLDSYDRFQRERLMFAGVYKIEGMVYVSYGNEAKRVGERGWSHLTALTITGGKLTRMGS